jgi:hypothetical protein
MMLKWRGQYRGGEIEVEATSLDELNSTVDTVKETLKEAPPEDHFPTETGVPNIDGTRGCADAVRLALGSAWGRKEPRTMAEMQSAFEQSAVFFSPGTLSGVLNHLTRTGQVRRLEKTGRWAYTLVSRT